MQLRNGTGIMYETIQRKRIVAAKRAAKRAANWEHSGIIGKNSLKISYRYCIVSI